VDRSGLVLQIGNNRRFDPGIAFAHEFVQRDLGTPLSFKAWYWDSVYRYTMTDNLQTCSVFKHRSAKAVRRSQGGQASLFYPDPCEPPCGHGTLAWW